MPNVQQISPDDEQRRCPKHVELYDRIKFWIISASNWLFNYEVYHVAWSHEYKVLFDQFHALKIVQLFKRHDFWDYIPANRIHSIFLSSTCFTCILVFSSSLRPGTHSSTLFSVTQPEIYMYFSHLPRVIVHTLVLRVSLSHRLFRLCYVCFCITCELIFILHVYLFHLSTFISVTLVSLT